MAKIIVSGCLFGCDCRYKGDNCKCEELLALADEHILIPVCPEQMGGLSTPRDPADIVGDKVISNHGKDVTYEYTKGAETALYIAKLNNARNPNNNGWVNTEDKEVFKIARISDNTIDRQKRIGKLCAAGLYRQ